MGANFSPCLTLLTALVSITSALGMFNNPRETEKYQHDLLDTLVQVMAKGQGRSLEDVLRDAFFVRPDQLKGYEEYTIELDNKVKDDMDDHYNKLIQLLTIDDLYQDYDDVDYTDNHVINAKRNLGPKKMKQLYQQSEVQGGKIQQQNSIPSSQKLLSKSKQKFTCPTGQDGVKLMTCPTNPSKCLTDSMICDGKNDCPKNEDEEFTLCVVRRWFKALEKKLTFSAQVPSV